LRRTEKKFHWSRRFIATNGIFVVTNRMDNIPYTQYRGMFVKGPCSLYGNIE
jgi:hypothetical protein